MADDIFLSPEEQDERARKWFKDNGPALAIGIVLGLAAVVSYNKYEENTQLNAEQASALFQSAQTESIDSGLADINEQVAELKEKHATTVYASKAALIKAKQTAVNDLPAAFGELQWLVDNAPEVGLQHSARIRQAKIKIALNELDQAKALASFEPTDGFSSHYQEVLGDIAVKNGNESEARAHYQAAIDALDGLQDSYVQILNIKLDRLPVTDAVSSEVDLPEAESPEAASSAVDSSEVESASETDKS